MHTKYGFEKLLSLLIAVWWRSMTSDLLVIVGYVNGLALVRRQTITQTNANKLPIGSLFYEPMSVKFKSKHRFSFQENAFQNVVNKMSAILFRPQSV